MGDTDDVEPSINVTLKRDSAIFDPSIFTHFAEDHLIDTSDLERYDKGTINEVVTISKVNNSIRSFMNKMKNLIDKKDENKLQTLKNHQTLHYDYYVQLFGSICNFNGGCNEQNMKSQVTLPSTNTQKRASSLSYQTGT